MFLGEERGINPESRLFGQTKVKSRQVQDPHTGLIKTEHLHADTVANSTGFVELTGSLSGIMAL